MMINHSLEFIEKHYTVHEADEVCSALGIYFEVKNGHVIHVGRDHEKERVITGYKKRLTD